MTTENPPVISSSTKKVILVSALLGYVVLIVYILYFVGIGALIDVIQRASLGLYTFAILSVIISILFHTLVWYQLLRCLSIKLSFKKTFSLYWVGVFVDNLIPGGWSGDLFKAYLLNKDPKIQSGKAVASVVAKNVYEAIFNLGGMVFGLTLLFINYTLEVSLLLTLGGIIVLLTLPLIVLLSASFRPEGTRKIIVAFFNALSRFTRNRWKLDLLRAKVEKGLNDYHDGMKTLLENPRILLKPMFLSFLAWGFEIVTLLFVFASLSPGQQLLSLDKVVIVRSIAGNVEAQGYAFVGYAQVISSEIYRSLGVPFAIGASVALLGGVVVFLVKTGISYVAFHRIVISPKKRSRSEKKSELKN